MTFLRVVNFNSQYVSEALHDELLKLTLYFSDLALQNSL